MAETEIVQPQSRRRGFLIVVVVVAVVIAAGIWWRSTYSEDTDDAQVNGHLIQVSSRIAGQVLKVDVEENQVVKAGDTIAELDPRDYQVAVENAEAALASAQANAAAANVAVPITTVNTGSNLRSAGADVSGTQASVAQAEKQLDSAKARVAQAAGQQHQGAGRFGALQAAGGERRHQQAAVGCGGGRGGCRQGRAGGRKRRASRRRPTACGWRMSTKRPRRRMLKYAETGPQQVAAQSARAKQALAQVAEAQAQLDQAKLNLSYTKIVAPAAGIITRKSVEIDQNVAAGQNLLTLVSLEDLWVTANFKETQLKYMSAGQPVEIAVDATGKKYHGKVTQIGGATGSVLSLFPPENATGNYVKVVQRVPVRVDFTDLANEDPDHLLRPGLSVEPKVRVKN
jgi:membrane fusion protein (multidrug efflux system)